MGGVLGMLMVLGLLLTFGPIGASAIGANVGGITSAIMVVSGIGLLIVSAVAIIITRLYVKTKADEAFVRTGMGGMKVIKDGGAVVIPVVHQCVKVPLRTFRLEVQRQGADALLTSDKLRADIKAEFFVRVQPNDEDIIAAARSLGDRTAHEQTIKELIEDKLVSALRTVAATKTLEELNSQRDEFVKKVMDSVTADLQHNGFKLETATISRLDQAPTDALKKDNVFDAEGLATIARITQKKLTEANGITRDEERAREQQNVDTRKRMLTLQQDQQTAEASQQAAIAKAKSEQDLIAKQAQFTAEQTAAQAEYAKQQATEVAKQQAEQAASVAEQVKQQAVGVAVLEREKAVAEAEKGRVEAEAQRLAAEKLRETETRAIETVKVKAKAERDKEQLVIAAEAAAQTQYVTAAKRADADAYAVQKSADAKKAAAAADAEAITKRAEADATAATRRAEGEKAMQMVPVEVKKAEVDVESKRVEVLKTELEAREEHGKTAQDFEVAKLRIVQESLVRIEAAKAVAAFGAKFETTLFGTPEDVARMQKSMLSGMGVANAVNGFFEGASPETAAATSALGDHLVRVVEAIAAHVGVKALPAPSPNGDSSASGGAAPAPKGGGKSASA